MFVSVGITKMFFVTVIRTLTGHQTSVKCMDFHPFGDFVASGSLGTFVKVSPVC